MVWSKSNIQYMAMPFSVIHLANSTVISNSQTRVKLGLPGSNMFELYSKCDFALKGKYAVVLLTNICGYTLQILLAKHVCYVRLGNKLG